MTTIEMRVHMDCPGCVSKIKKSLQKLKGVDAVDIDMPLQKVTVTGWADQKKVLKTVRRTGRRAELWQFPHNPEHHNIFENEHLYNQYQHKGPITGNAPQPSSSYNYYKHGYDYSHDYSNNNTGHATFSGNQAGAVFSDENPHGCFVM